MSILIKGMTMPKNCDECRIMTYEDTNCISIHELFCGCPIVFMAHPQHEENRPDYCPLIEVPKHGRLIDADELKASIQSSDTDEYQILSTKQLHDQLNKWIDGRETIIEAEVKNDSN